MSPCAAATQKNSGILGICTAVFSATLWLIYVITAWMLVTILNISIRKTDYNFSLKYKNILNLLTISAQGPRAAFFIYTQRKNAAIFPQQILSVTPFMYNFHWSLTRFSRKARFRRISNLFSSFPFLWYLLCSRRKLALNARKAFSRISIENFLSNSSTSSFFFSAFWLLVIPLCNP